MPLQALPNLPFACCACMVACTTSPPSLPAAQYQPRQAAQRRAYKLAEWADAEDFLTQLARAAGKLTKGGEPDLNTAAKMVLSDWQKGKLPYFTNPPGHVEGAEADGADVGGTAEGAAEGVAGGLEVGAAEAAGEVAAPAEAVTVRWRRRPCTLPC